ncbi:unnamed protein product [Taenia asiatica]|uniref:DUF1540 domain-containing protein n=1 Tax=Taenia asiatica TaxID=60517 RepID=A0A0R3VT75_TAEAS|nr:unnamed protein product [Taenia asiatica]
MNKFAAYIVGMEEQLHCKSNTVNHCAIADLLPLVPYNVCVRNCRQETAITKSVSSSIEGAQLVSSDVLEVATAIDADKHKCSDAICENVTIRLKDEIC